MIKLNVENRDLEMKSGFFRGIGMVPGIIYGATIQNTPVVMTKNELNRAMKESGEVYQVKSKRGEIFVRMEEVQKDPVSDDLIHFSLVQLPKGVENDVEIPVTLQGVPVGVKKGGVLVVLKDQVTISGKPSKIPDEVMADVSTLDIGDKLIVDDLMIPRKVEAIEEDSEVIAVCKPPVKEVATVSEEFSDEKENLIDTLRPPIAGRAI